MQVFGPNPRAEFLADIEYFKDKYRDSDPDRTDRLSAAEQRLNNEFDFLEGKANQPVHRLAAKIFAGTRAVVAMGRLGLVSLTHLSAAATKASELRWQGVNAFERYGNFISSLHPGRSAIAEELLAGYEGMSRDLMSRFNADDSFPGVVNKLSNLSFKWNGLTWLLNHQRQGGEELMAHHLGRQMDRPYDEILPESQRLLRLYGIEAREWEMLRNAPDHITAPDLVGGTRTYLTPAAALRIPEDRLVSHLFDTGQIDKRIIPPGPAEQRKVDAFREDLAMRLYAMFNDRSQRMVITPDIATRALLLQNTQPGTAWGEIARSVAQFKTWPTAMLQTTLDRDFKGQPRTAAIAGTVQAAAVATVLGYMIMSLKDLLKGKNPRDPSSPKTWAAALMQAAAPGSWATFCSASIPGLARAYPTRS